MAAIGSMAAMLVACMLALSLTVCPQGHPDVRGVGATPKTATRDICERFTGYDHNADGVVEIARVTELHAAGESGPRILVLVESRLATATEGQWILDARIARLVADLAKEGFSAIALNVDLGKSSLHQDGRYLLALRQMLRAFADQGELAGALLLGRFPDAFVVRTCNWRKHGLVKLRAGKPNEARYRQSYLRRVPEDVAHRADIVLSDLQGHWEDIYVQPRTVLPTTVAVFEGEIPVGGGAVVDLEHGSVEFEDFFHVSDGKLEVREVLGADHEVAGHEVVADDRSGDHECSIADQKRSNALAVPDIVVSRIDARGVALAVRTDVVGVAGERLLDADGKPQAVAFAERGQVPDWRSVWQLDPVLERKLLADYLDRNHAYRTGKAKIAWRPTSIAHGLGSGFAEMSKAASDWSAGDKKQSDVRGHATLASVARWLGYPAILRTLRAHSDQWGSVFERAGMEVLTPILNGPAWSWSRQGNRLVPSMKSACAGGKLDWFLLHTLWKNGAVAAKPCFYHHTGCHGISPPGAARLPFDDERYGLRQGAESLLFFGNGLALLGRAKVFYDEPRGFAAALAEGKTFGAAWAHYFIIESEAENWARVGGDIGRKRSYFWSVLGDWTLRLKR